MSLKRTQILSITAALLFSAGMSVADEPGTVAVEAETGEKAPEVIIHKIVPKDTLWDITEYYLKDPFKWPNIWKINPYIKNPHLIYPGNTVKLTPNGVELLEPDEVKAEGLGTVGLEPGEGEVLVLEPEPGQEAAPAAAVASVPKGPSLHDHAIARSGFVSVSELEASGAVVKAKEERTFLSELDEVFLSFKENSEVKKGGRYTIYSVGKKISHPETGKALGHEIEVLGSLTITKAEGVTEAVIDKTFKEVPLGAKVKPYVEPVREVEITKAEAEVSGVIVMALEGRENLGAGDIAYLDKGSSDGLRKGNVMRIFRPVEQVEDPMRSGKDMTLPALELGTLVVLEANESTSAAVVVKGIKAINWGDKVSTKETY